MKFLIQNNLIPIDKLNLIKEAVKRYPHSFVNLVPYSFDIDSDLLNNKDYIPIGSTLLTLISIKHNFFGLYYNPKTFLYSMALENRSDMLNDTVLSVKESLKVLKSKNTEIFVRPNDDLKQFTGTTINSYECYDWFIDALECKHGSYRMTPDMNIVISKPQQIESEWRWFIINGEIVSGSLYKHKNKITNILETDKRIVSIAKDKVKEWIPHKHCTMDIAKVNNTFKVIEFNCINSSGFYASDINLIFEKMYNST